MTIATIYDQDAMILDDGIEPRSRSNECFTRARSMAEARNASVILFDGEDWYQVTRTGKAHRFTARNARFGHFVAAQ
jgi:hypothetical protein